MKPLYFLHHLLILLLLICSGCNNKTAAKPVNPKMVSIYIDENVAIKESVKSDVLSLLEKNVDVEFSRNPVSSGINIHSHFHNKSLNLNDQEFYFESGSDYVNIVCSNNIESSQRALYFLLYQLGYEFLWYSDAWTIIPEEFSLTPRKGEVIVPKVNSLYFGGTGGLNPFKEQSELDKRYKQRNLWQIGDFSPVGHSLSGFYVNKKKEIDALHKKGEIIFNDYKKAKKKDLNIDNPLTIKLLKAFFIDKLEENPSLTQISVSPFDALGEKRESMPTSIPEVKTLGDKHWYWVREVALEVQKHYPDVTVKVNAYGNGPYYVKPPKFELPSNILVQLVPDAFQTGYDTRNEMYGDWQNKAIEDGFDKFYYYAYFNITQWSKGGLPVSSQKRHLEKLLIDIEAMNLTGFKLETTHFVIMAPHLYVLNKKLLGYDKASVDQLYVEFYIQAFPKSHQIIQPMFQRWFSGEFYGEYDLSNSLREIQQAYYYSSADENEKERLRELMIYLHYLSLYYEAKDQNSVQSAVKMEKYALSTSSYGVLQTKAITYYDYGKIKPYKYKGSPLFKKGIPKEKQISNAQILSDFNEDLKKYPINKNASKFTFSEDKQVSVNENNQFKQKLYKANNHITLKLVNGENITFNIIKPQNTFTFSIEDEKGNTVCSESGSINTINCELSGPGSYEIKYSSHAEELSFQTKGVIINRSIQPRPGNKFNTYYMYIPKDVDEIIYRGIWNSKISFEYPVSQVDNYKLANYEKMYSDTYKIPTHGIDQKTGKVWDARGKVWKIQHVNNNWDILNFEKVTSPFKFIYID